MEAHHIRHYVLSLPRAERRAVETRFATAKQRLQETGLLDRLSNPTWNRSAADHQKLGFAYLQAGISCPFLVDESCSIHPQRPIVCREYLVTSPPRYCSQPDRELIEGVERSGTVSRILAVLEARTSGSKGPWVPLATALEWASVHAEPSPGPTSVEIFDAFFNKRPVWPEASVAIRQRKKRNGEKRKKQ
jgi:Fe-S-cluster containining protein